ncbi:hypothetical protein EVAR_99395_1 [Eumeta japonica]|uniref:Uncharacterized protein n=1 Tax=Eumeta variegata TaxID=151549 RepID=A0A4C1SRL4_EUMVA|nr:hypothetical protein EVAR_99395_1 [Eumeta japonica]
MITNPASADTPNTNRKSPAIHEKPTHNRARRGSFMAAERATFGHTRRTGQCRRIISVDMFDEAPSTPTVHHTYPISSYTRKCTGYSYCCR